MYDTLSKTLYDRQKAFFLAVHWGSFLVMIFSLVDWLVYPQLFFTFLVIRLSMVAFFYLGYLYSKFNAEFNKEMLILPLGIIVSFGISLMCNLSGEGYMSGYYVGLIVLLAAGAFFIFDIRIMISFVLSVYLTYVIVMHFVKPVPYFPRYIFERHAFLLGAGVAVAFSNIFINNLRQKLEFANRRSEYLVKVFSHDIKNRISSGLLNLEILQEKLFNNKMLDQAISDQGHMRRNVFNLINVFSQEDIVLKKQSIAAGDVLQKSFKDWKEKLANKNINIFFENGVYDNIEIDKDYMDLVWENLFANCYANTPEGGVVKIKQEIVKDKIVFSFANSGDTVEIANQKEIFDKYKVPQKHSVCNKGLGLSYVKMMVKMHKGRIYYRINDQGLNEFVVELPR